MLSFLIAAIKIVFVLGFLILIHETGHFLVAKLSHVKVKEFAIGFRTYYLEKTRKRNEICIKTISITADL